MGRGDEKIGASIIWQNEHCGSEGWCVHVYILVYVCTTLYDYNNYVFAFTCVPLWTYLCMHASICMFGTVHCACM